MSNTSHHQHHVTSLEPVWGDVGAGAFPSVMPSAMFFVGGLVPIVAALASLRKVGWPGRTSSVLAPMRRGVLGGGVDMAGHEGLRGLLALHVAVFHFLLWLPKDHWGHINIQGHIDMPWFFLLSGFALAVVYGGRTDDALGTWAGKGRFLQNRMARILPLYVVAQVASVPPVLLGHFFRPTASVLAQASFNALTGTASWFQPGKHGFPLSFSGPAWTISTLFFFYLAFPVLLRRLRAATAPSAGPNIHVRTGVSALVGACTAAAMVAYLRWKDPDAAASASAERPDVIAVTGDTAVAELVLGAVVGLLGALLAWRSLGDYRASGVEVAGASATSWIAVMFWVQLSFGLVMHYYGLPVVGDGYWAGTAWPPSRLPVFSMGIIAGLAVAEASRNEQGSAGAAASTRGTRRLLRWGGGGKTRSAGEWARYTDSMAGVYVAILTAATVAKQLDVDLHSDHLLQFLLPYVQLAITVGMTQDGGMSRTSCLCLWGPLRSAGKVSAGIYLFHCVVAHYLILARVGPMQHPPAPEDGSLACKGPLDELTEVCQTFRRSRKLPWGLEGVLVITALSVVAAVLAGRYIEGPARDRLRVKRPAARVLAKATPAPVPVAVATAASTINSTNTASACDAPSA